MAGRQRHELLAPIVEERICGDKERIGSRRTKRREGRIDLASALASQVEQTAIATERCRGFSHLSARRSWSGSRG